MPKFIDLTGKRFGRLTVLGRASDKTPGVPRWDCLCDCGNTTNSRSDTFKKNPNASCGCYNEELSAARLKTHGMSYSPEYQAWHGMLARCNSPSNTAYYKYGARGIRVCDRWIRFENFYADMGNKPSAEHSLDRIDGTKGYEPNNCRWATRKEQQRNIKNNVRLTYDGKSLTVDEWSSIVGIKPKTIQGRIRLGWSVEDALTKPKNFYHLGKRAKRKA